MLIHKRAIFVLFVCFVEILVLFVVSPVTVRASTGAATSTPTVIAVDTIWDAAHSPYVLSGDIDVMPGTKLTILPGTRLVGDGRVYVDHATLDVDGADFHDGPTIYAVDSTVSVASTTLMAGAGDGIHMEGGRLDARRDRFERMSGAAIRLADSPHSSVTAGVYDSVFKDNASAIVNTAQVPVEAQNNWWGQPGTTHPSGPNNVSGRVFFLPALVEEPGKVCCSSVLFIPGVEGTQLYEGTTRLWEPFDNGDVRKLYMDSGGASIRPVSSGQVIGSAYGLHDVYASFLRFLDKLAASSTVSQVRTFGYDWRLLPDTVAGQGLEDIVRSMAGDSKTGKVTIVAHSNGGLVAKSLVRRLAFDGGADLIDRVVSVAVPYTGAPEGLLGLLHGDHQDILGGLILSRDTAKGLAQNMPSAYSLLPSIAYAAASSSPFITGAYTSTDHQSLWSFLSTRSNTALLAAADSFHAALDPFTWPRQIAHAALVGWSILTTTGVHYDDSFRCSLRFLTRVCKTVEAHTAELTSKGDGVVVASSAEHDAGQVASLDLGVISHAEGASFDHANIMESHSVQELIGHILADKPLTEISVDGFLLAGEPREDSGYVRISVSGDADLTVYDSSQHQIGQKRLLHDDAGTTTSVYLPKSSGQTYSAVATSGGLGYISLSAQKVENGAVTAHVGYEPVLTLPGTVVSTPVDGSLSSPPEPVAVDLDGNGSTDLSVATSSTGLPNNATSTADVPSELATTTVDALRTVLCK